MIRQAKITVIETEKIYQNTYVTWYSSPELTNNALPGQFIMLQPTETLDPYLPRAFSFYRFRERLGERQFALLYNVIGEATKLMAKQEPGEISLAVGPLGKGFEVRSTAKNLLLIGGGVGIAPLIALADQEINRDCSITLGFGARETKNVYPARLLSPEIEYIAATEDGSLGRKGLVTEIYADYLDWADQTFACGPVPMFRSMAAIAKKDGFRRPTQILMETEMACGYGLCYGCAVFTKNGVRLCCKDGPCFELLDVFDR